eukprot:GHVU01008852.1.p1 GENE.GHVU01008852.1~~GHVU01008852.1.p1  ORF type:complete len:239 (-),score=54.30 GHVU01008852.1:519-1235(-)
MHLSCAGLTKDEARKILKETHEAGVHNLLLLKGDPPKRAPGEPDVEGDFPFAIDLVTFVKEEFGGQFCVCVAGHPGGHPRSKNPIEEIRRLREKCDAGVDVVITQFFYDAKVFNDFVERARTAGIDKPILPGLMVPQSVTHFLKMVEMTETYVPSAVEEKFGDLKTDAECAEYSRELMTTLVGSMKGSQHPPAGLHFFTMNSTEPKLLTTIEACLKAPKTTPPPSSTDALPPIRNPPH